MQCTAIMSNPKAHIFTCVHYAVNQGLKKKKNVQMCPKQQTHKAYQSLLHPE